MMVASRASAQIEFAQSTRELRPETEPAPTHPVAASQQAVSEHRPSNLNDPAPEPNAAPQNYAPQQIVRPANYMPTVVEPQFKNHSRPLVNPYSSASAQAAMNKLPRPMQVQSAPARQPVRPRGKPFQSVESEPAISPYLNLYRNDSSQNPTLNYYSMVRPQLDQIEANKKQAAELQKLRSQVQNATQRGGPPQPVMGGASSSEGMTVSAHYMDTAQFYHRTRK
jgi:hypothetical protein